MIAEVALVTASATATLLAVTQWNRSTALPVPAAPHPTRARGPRRARVLEYAPGGSVERWIDVVDVDFSDGTQQAVPVSGTAAGGNP